MKYIDFESLTITWLHECNVIVEDQLTHSGSRTASPKAVFWRSAKCEQKLTLDSVLRCPRHWQAGLWKLDWLRLSIVSLLWFTFLFIVLWNVFGVQKIICHSRFCSGCSKYSELMNFPWGLKETVSSEKYIPEPRADNSILPMSVDTLPLRKTSM